MSLSLCRKKHKNDVRDNDDLTEVSNPLFSYQLTYHTYLGLAHTLL